MGDNIAWLTGSRGFIGRPLLSALKINFPEVRCFTNRPIVEGSENQENSCQHMDYSNPDDIKDKFEKLGSPNIFIHLGWGGMTEPGAKVHLEENVKDGKFLIDTVYECGVSKFLFIGSMNEYGGRTGSLSDLIIPEA